MGIIESTYKWTKQSLYQLFLSDFSFEKDFHHHFFGKCEIHKSLTNPKIKIMKHFKLSLDLDFQDFSKSALEFQNLSHPNLITLFGILNQTSQSSNSSPTGISVFFEFHEKNLNDILKENIVKRSLFGEEFLRNIHKDLSSSIEYLKQNCSDFFFNDFGLENIYFVHDHRIKLLPTCFFKKKEKKYESEHNKIWEIIINLASLSDSSNDSSLNEKYLFVKKNYNLDFLKWAFEDIATKNEISCGFTDIITENFCPKTPKKFLTKNMVSFQDETFFMSPIKSEEIIKPCLNSIKKRKI